MARNVIEKALNEGKGVLRLAPNWVPRAFCRPGRRLRLHPDDYFALGTERGGIDERWFSSTTPADNGPGTPENQGLSFIVTEDGEEALLLDAVREFKGEIIGRTLYAKYGRWPIYSKFFDNRGPLPHHIHHNDEYAAKVGESGKPEMYFFPAQYNATYGGELPFTFFGFNPGTTKEQVRDALKAFTKGDNKLLSLSRAYSIDVDTGWDVPPGVMHAPASMCTYEPQFASDVYAMYQSVLYFDHVVSEDLLWKNCPEEKKGDFDYLIEVMDWEMNLDPLFYQHRRMTPKPVAPMDEMIKEGYTDEWICYKCDLLGAKRYTVFPGRSVTLKDSAAYGLICIQGFGTVNGMELSSPNMIRFGERTHDEYFVTQEASAGGVMLTNLSRSEPLVILRHFARE